MSGVQVSASLAAAKPSLGEEDDELFLKESGEVAAAFVSLVLEGELRAGSLGGKSPATSKIEQRGSRGPGASNAPQIASKLMAIGDDIDARVNKEIKKEIEEATADMLKNLSIYQLGMEQFNHLCHHVLRKCSTQMRSGWQQVSAVYMTAVQVVRQLHSDQPQGQPHDVVQRRQTLFQSFAGQYMRDVGLEAWVQNHGGMSNVLESSASVDELDIVPISDDDQ